MLKKAVDSIACGVMIGFIESYQRWLSPRKGFSCAYRAERGGDSCSQFARQAFRRGGFGPACRAVAVRLRQCGEAARSLRRDRAIALARLVREPKPDGEPIPERPAGNQESADTPCQCVNEVFAECCVSGCRTSVFGLR